MRPKSNNQLTAETPSSLHIRIRFRSDVQLNQLNTMPFEKFDLEDLNKETSQSGCANTKAYRRRNASCARFALGWQIEPASVVRQIFVYLAIMLRKVTTATACGRFRHQDLRRRKFGGLFLSAPAQARKNKAYD
jgi:hypothetical protein